MIQLGDSQQQIQITLSGHSGSSFKSTIPTMILL